MNVFCSLTNHSISSFMSNKGEKMCCKYMNLKCSFYTKF